MTKGTSTLPPLKRLRPLVIVLVAAAFVFGGVPLETKPLARASLVTTDVLWSAHGGIYESQIIDRNLSMVGLTWEKEGPLNVWYRTRANGRWGPWTQLPVEDVHGPDSGTEEANRSIPGSDPVWVGESDGVQFRMTGPHAQEVKAVLIDTSNSRRPVLSQLANFVTPRIPSASGAPERPLIRSRSEWDPDGECVPRNDPDEVQITHFFVHHTAGSNAYTESSVPGHILGICKFHLNGRGWNDIAYNFVIDKYGNIWEGRAGGIDRGIQGAHTAGFSTYSVGIAFLGTHISTKPSAVSEAALDALIAWKANVHNVNTSTITTVVSKGSAKYDAGVPVALPAISGHKDAQLTSCPGEACYDRLSTYRGRVAQQWRQVPLSTYVSPLVGDFDGDGKDEGALFRTTDGRWLLTDGNGSTSTWADFSTAKGWSRRLVGDFNGDGRDDIANFHPSNGTWWVSRSSGNGFSTTLWADFVTASGWTSQTVGDFDGDGRDDIANFHPSNGTWWVSRSTGNGFSTTMWTDFSTPDGWTIQEAGDFDGDGRDDIANRHVGNGTWWIVRSVGDSFAAARLWATNATLDHISHAWVQDFNGDGRDDIFTVDAYNGFLDRHRSNGTDFSINVMVDMPWRTTVGGSDRGRNDGTTGLLYFGQEFQWVKISNLGVSDGPAQATVIVTHPRP
jgi:hypothetical protein